MHQLWDAATGQPLGLPMKHDHAVKAVAISADGTRLATLCDEGAVGLWDLAGFQRNGATPQHADKVIAVAFSSDGSKFATGQR